MQAQINQRPPVIHGTLAENFFANVLINHTLVMYEQHPKSLTNGLLRQIDLKQKEFRSGTFFAFENSTENYRSQLRELTIMLCDSEMASHGYPLVFTNFDFLQQTKRFGEYNWPLFYLLDATESNLFAISGAYTPEPRHFFPYTLPPALTANYHDVSRQVYQQCGFDRVLVTGNSKLAPNWAKRHIQRARDTGLFSQFLVIGEAGDYQVLTQREFANQTLGFRPTDPIVVGKRRFHKSFGPDLGDVTLERYYVVTAYDPSKAELKILKALFD